MKVGLMRWGRGRNDDELGDGAGREREFAEADGGWSRLEACLSWSRNSGIMPHASQPRNRIGCEVEGKVRFRSFQRYVLLCKKNEFLNK